MTASPQTTPEVLTEEVVTTSNTVSVEQLGIQLVTCHTVGTVQELQKQGELEVRIVHEQKEAEPANPEIEAIKQNLKYIGQVSKYERFMPKYKRLITHFYYHSPTEYQELVKNAHYNF